MWHCHINSLERVAECIDELKEIENDLSIRTTALGGEMFTVNMLDKYLNRVKEEYELSLANNSVLFSMFTTARSYRTRALTNTVFYCKSIIIVYQELLRQWVEYETDSKIYSERIDKMLLSVGRAISPGKSLLGIPKASSETLRSCDPHRALDEIARTQSEGLEQDPQALQPSRDGVIFGGGFAERFLKYKQILNQDSNRHLIYDGNKNARGYNKRICLQEKINILNKIKKNVNSVAWTTTNKQRQRFASETKNVLVLYFCFLIFILFKTLF